jgi:hypothetical protein
LLTKLGDRLSALPAEDALLVARLDDRLEATELAARLVAASELAARLAEEIVLATRLLDATELAAGVEAGVLLLPPPQATRVQLSSIGKIDLFIVELPEKFTGLKN